MKKLFESKGPKHWLSNEQFYTVLEYVYELITGSDLEHDSKKDNGVQFFMDFIGQLDVDTKTLILENLINMYELNYYEDWEYMCDTDDEWSEENEDIIDGEGYYDLIEHITGVKER